MRRPWKRRCGPATCLALCLAWGLLACQPGEEASEPDSVQPKVETSGQVFSEVRDAAFDLVANGAPDVQLRLALQEARALKPEAYGVNVMLGQVCERMGLAAESADAYEVALAARPDDMATLRALVLQSMEAGRHQRVRELLEQVSLAPSEAGSVLLLEVRLLVEGEQGNSASDEVAALLARGLEIEPVLAVEALTILGKWLHETGQHDLARGALLGALAGAPSDTAVLKTLAAACWRLGLEPEAQRWQEVLELLLGLQDNVFTREQKTSSGEANQRQALENSDYIRREMDLHRERLARLTVIHPLWPDAFLELAEVQAAAGEQAEACSTLQGYFSQHGTSLTEVERQTLLRRYCR